MRTKVRTTLPHTQIINETEQYVRRALAKDSTGHDWHHIERVRRMAIHIAHEESVDIFLVDMMALLHELPDRKIAGAGNEKKALLKIRGWLTQRTVPEDKIDEILYVIENQSYSKSGLRSEKLQSEAGCIVQDADRLEALGAIGIARVFAYGGKTRSVIHDPTLPVNKQLTEEEYRAERKYTSINHFYEKLLKLKDLMNTTTARRIAEHRHRFMEKYLQEFFAEWEGKK